MQCSTSARRTVMFVTLTQPLYDKYNPNCKSLTSFHLSVLKDRHDRKISSWQVMDGHQTDSQITLSYYEKEQQAECYSLLSAVRLCQEE